jgi:hypothetical protein
MEASLRAAPDRYSVPEGPADRRDVVVGDGPFNTAGREAPAVKIVVVTVFAPEEEQ